MSKNDKVVFLSKLFFFTEDNKLIKENLWIADLFYSYDIMIVIVAKKPTVQILKIVIPEEYKEKVVLMDRSKESKELVKSNKEEGDIFGMIGVVKEDAHFAFNCKIPLFNSERVYLGEADISEKVKNYGLPIIEFKNVINCLNSYDAHKSNYFYKKFSDNYIVTSLINANTYNKPDKEVKVKDIFKANLKGNESARDQQILLLLLFQLMNEVITNKEFKDIDYWGIFPSSDSENTNTSVAFLKEAVRVSINGKPKTGPEILIRKSSTPSKHSSDNKQRFSNKSDKDFETLIINPVLIREIRGKVVCIIDDYITNGYSAEAAKHLLLAAGVKKVIFISIGKFGKVYYATNYAIQGDVSKKISYNFVNEKRYDEVSNGVSLYNSKNDTDILNFSDLV